MSNTILLKRNGNVAAVPAAANLSFGELSLNYADGVLYFLNNSNVVTVLANASTVSGTQLVNGTSNVRVASSSNVTISSAGTANVLTISSTGTVVTGTLVVTDNVTGAYFYGNGSQLTGISTSNGGNLWVVGRFTTYYVPIHNGILLIVSRTGNISVPIVA
jgi:uncharacterized protein with beta-barrel porin domain